ncbi:TOM9-2 [Scenedesmus sp. PABB004]|nr:TOM9-2 [Scenedesmus sp. PABB004]
MRAGPLRDEQRYREKLARFRAQAAAQAADEQQPRHGEQHNQGGGRGDGCGGAGGGGGNVRSPPVRGPNDCQIAAAQPSRRPAQPSRRPVAPPARLPAARPPMHAPPPPPPPHTRARRRPAAAPARTMAVPTLADARYVAKRLSLSVGKAAWLASTTLLVLLVPLVIEMDREAQLLDMEKEQMSVRRAHRARLPGPLRLMADDFLSHEARRHLEAKPTPAQWEEFGRQWSRYVETLNGSGPGGGAGPAGSSGGSGAGPGGSSGTLAPDVVASLSAAQKQQLAKLRAAAEDLARGPAGEEERRDSTPLG